MVLGTISDAGQQGLLITDTARLTKVTVNRYHSRKTTVAANSYVSGPMTQRFTRFLNIFIATGSPRLLHFRLVVLPLPLLGGIYQNSGTKIRKGIDQLKLHSVQPVYLKNLPKPIQTKEPNNRGKANRCVVQQYNAIIGAVTTGYECLPPSCDGLTGPDDH
ncbi:peroxidase 1-like [Dorcoceras hygrometricum]|uniref:Peroxidase 1-like n=1 Tax=Dorcoceras hygrometricum TaxID=472368 RepID=A0A2Z7DEU8_9LAMI|nr:peroxidase 1-like [Dorcoceras hygrometricum]